MRGQLWRADYPAERQPLTLTGNTERLLSELGVGFCAAPGNAVELRAQLERILALKGAAPRPVVPNAAPLDRFNRRILAGRLATLLDDARASSPAGNW